MIFGLPLANCRTPRVLYVHGGDWLYGVTHRHHYPQLISKLVNMSGLVFFLPDYPTLGPGNFTSIPHYLREALSWLATHGPQNCTNTIADAPPLFVAGDSAGGGIAASILLALQDGANPLLVDGLRVRLAGAALLSPWTNLECNTPTYQTNAYTVVNDTLTINSSNHSIKVPLFLGDVRLKEIPQTEMQTSRSIALQYVAGRQYLLNSSMVSPSHAASPLWTNAPPLFLSVGGAELILGDAIQLGQKAAQGGVRVYMDIYDSMWHVFHLYSEGCHNPSNTSLWQAFHALQRMSTFLRCSAANVGNPCPRLSIGNRSITTVVYANTSNTGPWLQVNLCGEDKPELDLSAPCPLPQGPTPSPSRSTPRSKGCTLYVIMAVLVTAVVAPALAAILHVVAQPPPQGAAAAPAPPASPTTVGGVELTVLSKD